MKTLLLDHPSAKRLGSFVMKSNHNAATGEITYKREWQSLPSALTVPALGTVKHLPDWVVEVDDVRAAVQAKAIRLVAEKAPTPTKAADTPDEPAATEAASSEEPENTASKKRSRKRKS